MYLPYTQNFEEWSVAGLATPLYPAWPPPSSFFSWAEKGACKPVFYVLETGQSSSKPYWSCTTRDSTTPRISKSKILFLSTFALSAPPDSQKALDFQTFKNHENTFHFEYILWKWHKIWVKTYLARFRTLQKFIFWSIKLKFVFGSFFMIGRMKTNC